MMANEQFIGEPGLPIELAFVESVVELLVTGSARLAIKHSVTDTMPEDYISQRLDREMEALHRGGDSDIVNWSMRPARSLLGNPDEVFEVDFSFHANIFPRDQGTYVGVETKRLRGRGRSLAGAYVDYGVMRFVSGQYSLGHKYAVMLGYVVVPPMGSAISKVQGAMDSRAEKTSQEDTFHRSTDLLTHLCTYTSVHLQRVILRPIKLVHIFVDLSR